LFPVTESADIIKIG